MTKQLLLDAINEAVDNVNALKNATGLHADFEKAVDLLVNTYKKGGALFVAGNGGSAADAQHFVAELVVKLSKDRDPIKAFALTVDTSILTAIGNDFTYDDIFSRQVEGLMGPNDVFMGITTSGNSPNILKAFSMAKKKGAKTILLSGKDGGKAVKENMADVNLIAPGPNTARIQEIHLIIYHTICYALEKRLIDERIISYR
ncbi:SIS domain-containing protein [bacterium]|nr:SIS domain-containing protein [bacterium]